MRCFAFGNEIHSQQNLITVVRAQFYAIFWMLVSIIIKYKIFLIFDQAILLLRICCTHIAAM